MSDEENFISRWSRRKREAADEAAQPEKADPAQIDASEEPGPGSQTSTASSSKEFNVSSLPPIETIGAGTDITAFMQPGVPGALRHAALRRVWAADPAIRNFVGLNENYWNDAAGAAAAPGFGDLDPGVDVKRMVSELFGDSAPEKPERESQAMSTTPAVVSEQVVGQTDQKPLPTQERIESTEAPATEVAAVHNEPEGQSTRSAIRRHGGALPE
ncbi:MAG TPA: DUF3306 domain-containing protein [Pseudolabrys sp.]|jgi:Protein of unknown function (DUF3306)